MADQPADRGERLLRLIEGGGASGVLLMAARQLGEYCSEMLRATGGSAAALTAVHRAVSRAVRIMLSTRDLAVQQAAARAVVAVLAPLDTHEDRVGAEGTEEPCADAPPKLKSERQSSKNGKRIESVSNADCALGALRSLLSGGLVGWAEAHEPLRSSQGAEFDIDVSALTVAEKARQRAQLKRELEIVEGQEDYTASLLDEDGSSASAGETSSASASGSAGACTDLGEKSSRQRAMDRRKAPRGAALATQATRPYATLPLPDATGAGGETEKDVAAAYACGRTVCTVMLALRANALHVNWTTRHGAVLGLREILGDSGLCAAVRLGFDAGLGAVLARDMLAVLALDRFSDFQGDALQAPVREHAARVLAAVCKAETAAEIFDRTRADAWAGALQLAQCADDWQLRHAGFLSASCLQHAAPGVMSPSELFALGLAGSRDNDDDVCARGLEMAHRTIVHGDASAAFDAACAVLDGASEAATVSKDDDVLDGDDGEDGPRRMSPATISAALRLAQDSGSGDGKRLFGLAGAFVRHAASAVRLQALCVLSAALPLLCPADVVRVLQQAAQTLVLEGVSEVRDAARRVADRALNILEAEEVLPREALAFLVKTCGVALTAPGVPFVRDHFVFLGARNTEAESPPAHELGFRAADVLVAGTSFGSAGRLYAEARRSAASVASRLMMRYGAEVRERIRGALVPAEPTAVAATIAAWIFGGGASALSSLLAQATVCAASVVAEDADAHLWHLRLRTATGDVSPAHLAAHMCAEPVAEVQADIACAVSAALSTDTGSCAVLLAPAIAPKTRTNALAVLRTVPGGVPLPDHADIALRVVHALTLPGASTLDGALAVACVSAMRPDGLAADTAQGDIAAPRDEHSGADAERIPGEGCVLLGECAAVVPREDAGAGVPDASLLADALLSVLAENAERALYILAADVLPRMDTRVDERLRIIRVVEHLLAHEDMLAKHASLLLLPVLRRVSDADVSVRGVALPLFASLLRLVPLSPTSAVDDGAVLGESGDSLVSRKNENYIVKRSEGDEYVVKKEAGDATAGQESVPAIKKDPMAEGAGDASAVLSRLRSEADAFVRVFVATSVDDSARRAAAVPEYTMPVSVNAELRPYQRAGIAWLAFLGRCGLNGALCDDMGLGKTLQTICVLASSHAERRAASLERLPSLVVCPASLLGHWRHEVLSYAGEALPRVVVYAGTARDRRRDWAALLSGRYASPEDALPETGGMAQDDGAGKRTRQETHGLDDAVVVCSYETLRTDAEGALAAVRWNYIVLDEGHQIRNPRARITLAAKSVRAEHRVLLSGTPIQNSVVELWSLFDFLMPGMLGAEAVFMERYGRAIAAVQPRMSATDAGGSAKSGPGAEDFRRAEERLAALHRQVLPFVLRRMKEDVLRDLPPKTIQDVECDMSPVQQALYAELGADTITDTDKQHVFARLRHMSKVCVHPALAIGGEPPSSWPQSVHTALAAMDVAPAAMATSLAVAPKLLLLQELLEQSGALPPTGDAGEQAPEDVFAPLHKVLIFAQQRATLDLVERLVLRPRNAVFRRLDGTVEARQRFAVAQEFNADASVGVLLLTTQVGGLGLNLTGADTVIFVEHDWNPQRDLQAMDRAHRLGQRRAVTVYRLMVRGTLEQHVLGLQRWKTRVAATVVRQQGATDLEGKAGASSMLDVLGGASEHAEGRKRARPSSQRVSLAQWLTEHADDALVEDAASLPEPSEAGFFDT